MFNLYFKHLTMESATDSYLPLWLISIFSEISAFALPLLPFEMQPSDLCALHAQRVFPHALAEVSKYRVALKATYTSLASKHEEFEARLRQSHTQL
jgi:hypothetical protein